MSQTVITAHINDQTIQLANTTTIASGSVGVLQIQCDFDSQWTGYTKTAVFYRHVDKVYHVKLTPKGLATVPPEVLAEEGTFCFGIMGIGENTRTTEVLRITVVQGAITTASANSAEPTPDIYQQLMQAHALMEARFVELLAGRGTDGEDRTRIQDEHVLGYITHNGAVAQIDIEFSGVSLVEGDHHYTDYLIPPGLASFADVELRTSNQDLDITMLAADPTAGGWARLLVEHVGQGSYNINMVTAAKAFYPLTHTYIGEVGDIRIGYDAKVHPTAGDAVRAQVNSVLETLCPTFSEKGGVVRCEPVNGYPINVRSYFGASFDSQERPVPYDDFDVELTLCGKNLYDRENYPLVEGRYITTSGKLTGYNSGTSYAGTDKFIPVRHLRGKQITLNHPPVEAGGSNPRMIFYTAANEDEAISGSGGNGYTHTVPQTAAYMRFSVPKAYKDGTQIQIELGTMVTAFESYRKPQSFTATPHYAGLDFYQGYFDWNTGELYSTHDLESGQPETLEEKPAPVLVATTSPTVIRPEGSSIIYGTYGDTEVSGRANPCALIDILTRKLETLSTAAIAVPVGSGTL